VVDVVDPIPLGYLDALVAHGDDIPEETNTTAAVSLGITVRTPIIV